MSVTSGFFNSLSGDRKYDAIQISSMFDGLITDGIYNGFLESFMVTASDPASMVVTVGEGRCWFNHTWTLNDAPLPLTLDVGDVVLNRIDTVVIDVDSTDTVRACTIKVVKGTPSSQAVAPSLENTETHHQYPLCDISVVAGATTVTQSNITNRRGTSDCPFVATLMKSVNVDDLLIQWESQWDDWMTDRADAMDTWTAEQQEAFTTWFQTVQDTLDEDTAGNLYNLITNNTGINATATHAEGVVAITATGNPVNIVFLAPSDWAEADTYTYNGSPVELVDLLGEPVEDAWVQGSPVSLTVTGGKAFFKNGGGRYKPTDLPPLNPNFTMEISEGDSEDTVTVTADKLTISPTTDMLAGGQWEYGTEMSPAPGKGQNIKHWTREQLVTSGKPFDGLLLGDVTASDAVNETILWIPENQNGETVLVPFIVLSVDYFGGVYITRLNAWKETMFSTVNDKYFGSEIDRLFTDTYINSVLHESVASMVMDCDIQIGAETEKRKVFALSNKEIGGSAQSGNEQAMPFFGSNENRKAVNDLGQPVLAQWTRTTAGGGWVYTISQDGSIGSYTYSQKGVYARPAFVLPKDFQIQQRPDGSYTVYNDYGLITLNDIQASTDASLTKINIGQTNGLKVVRYLSNGYVDNSGALLEYQDSVGTSAFGSSTYSSSTLRTSVINYCTTYLPDALKALVQDTKFMASTGGSSVSVTDKFFVLSLNDYAGDPFTTALNNRTYTGQGQQIESLSTEENRKRSVQITTRQVDTTGNYPGVIQTSGAPYYNYNGTSNAQGYCPAFMLPLTAPIRLLADGTYDLVPEDPSLSAQTVSTLAEEQSGTAVQLNQIPAGSVLKIKENGQDVDFYVARHNYESDLNGAGRTLMVRKDCYDNQVWDSGNVNAYATSDLDSWFNSTYKNMLDAESATPPATATTRWAPWSGLFSLCLPLSWGNPTPMPTRRAPPCPLRLRSRLPIGMGAPFINGHAPRTRAASPASP